LGILEAGLAKKDYKRHGAIEAAIYR
jgi:hypothetical protein